MQSYKASTIVPQIHRVLKPQHHQQARNMAFFLPRAAFNPMRQHGHQHAARNEFAPLWSLIDDTFNDLSRAATGRNGLGVAESFSPRFDMRETKEGYALEGELPGIEQKDVAIEFTDEHTLTIKGRSERHTESGTPPHNTAALESSSSGEKAAIEDKRPSSPHRATVEDEDDAGKNTSTKPDSSTEVAPTITNEQTQVTQPQHQYWISERHVGSFERSFNFPARVDQDAVKASLKNGILSIVVPKAKATQSRRVVIE